MDERIFVVLILGLFVIGFVSATSVGVYESEFTEGKVIYTSPIVSFINSTAYVNASEWWITNEGNLDNVADLLLSMFSLTWIDTDIDMVNNGLLNVGNIEGDGSGSYFNSTLLIDGDMAGGNATLVIEADSSHFACINMTEGNNIGMQICYDGAGANRAFVISNLLDGNEYFWIDRTTGLIHFNNDTVAVSLITETINSTDWSNASSALNGTFVPYTGATGNVDLGANNLYATNLGVTGIIAIGTISATNLFGTTLAGTTLNSNIYRNNDGSNILFTWDGSEIDVGQNLNLADNIKLYFGNADDVSHYFDGSTYQIKAEVGSPHMNFTNFGNYSFDNNILLENGEYIDNSVDGEMRFYGGGAVNNNYIKFKLDGTYFPTLTAHKASDDSAQAFRFGSTVSFVDDYAFEFGAVDAQFVWDTAQTNDAFILHLKSGTAGESGNFIIAHKDQWNYDFGLSSYTDPHLWLSAKGNSQTDLLGLHHNGTDGIIETISGDLVLNPAGNVNVLGNISVGGEVGLTGNYSVGSCWMNYKGGILTSTNCTAL